MITNKSIRDSVQNACESLTKIQDVLFDGARNAVKLDEETGWQAAEALFQFAKEADDFRRRLANLLNLEHSAPLVGPTKPARRGRSQDQTTGRTEEGPQKKKKADYPKYQITDNCLVKIGLQRDRRTEYQHIVQKAAFDKIVSAIVKQQANTKEFTPDTILAELNLPAYQTYVVLAMLRQMGLFKNPRRGLYATTDVRDFGVAASAVWNKLAARGVAE